MPRPVLDSRLTRRAALGLGAAAALTACSGAGGGGGGDSLYVSWYGADPVHKAMDTNLAAFGTAHPGATITSGHAPFADYWDKLATETASRQGPDVFRMSMSYFSEYADRGALLDLTDAVGSTITTDGMDPDVLDSGRIDGRMMAIGQSSISHAVFANTSLVEKVGGTVPDAWDWPAFAEFARGYAGEAGSKAWGTSDAGGNFQTFEVFVRQHGQEMFSDAGLAVGAEVITEWFDYWQQLRTAKAAPPPDVSAESGTIETSTLAKKSTPVTFGWVQQVTFYQPLVGEDTVEVMAVPGKTPGSTEGQFLKALDFWCVSGNTKSPELAQQLISYLINDAAAVASIGLTLGVPPSESSRTALQAKDGTAEGRAIAYVEKVADQVGPPPAAWPRGYGQLLTDFTRMNEGVAFGKTTPAEAATQFVDLAKQALA